MILAHGNDIYLGQAGNVGSSVNVSDVIAELIEAQKVVKSPVLTAKHIGLNLSVMSVNLNYLKEKIPFELVLVNASVINSKAPLVSGLEYDAAIPKLAVSIARPKTVQVEFLDEELKPQRHWFSDQQARWISNGIDLLNGKTIISQVNQFRQRSVKTHLRRVSEGKVEAHYNLILEGV